MVVSHTDTALPVPAVSAQQRYPRIAVIGLGYVGMPTALLFARNGFQVCGVDIDPGTVALVTEDRIATRYEELAEWTQSLASDGTTASDGALQAMLVPPPCDAFLITVPTPVQTETHRCDLTAVRAATEAVASVLAPGNLVILESTVPPGTTGKVVRSILEKTGLKAGQDFDLCFCPERVLPGNTIHELIHNHRVIGGINEASAVAGKHLFEAVVEGDILLTDDRTAEFCKLAENTYRDVNIALANELSIIGDELGVNLPEALPLINRHPRVNMLSPGIGVGGHCIAVDPWFFVEVSPWKTELIRTAREVNDRMPGYCVRQIMVDIQQLEQPSPRICLAGLTYKPDVADPRESPALRIAEQLEANGVDVIRYDPLLPDYADTTLLDAVTDVDYLAVLVGHSVLVQQLEANRDALTALMRTPTIRTFY